MFERTAQGLDRTPAELESQLDSGTEEQCAGPCPVSGIVKDQGGRVGGALEGRGRNASELKAVQRRGGGGWDRWAVQFLKGLCPQPCASTRASQHLSNRSAWAGPQGQGGGPGLAFIRRELGAFIRRELGAAQGQGGVPGSR